MYDILISGSADRADRRREGSDLRHQETNRRSDGEAVERGVHAERQVRTLRSEQVRHTIQTQGKHGKQSKKYCVILSSLTV